MDHADSRDGKDSDGNHGMGAHGDSLPLLPTDAQIRAVIDAAPACIKFSPMCLYLWGLEAGGDSAFDSTFCYEMAAEGRVTHWCQGWIDRKALGG